MVCLFDKNATSFAGNGMCVLDPTVCTVSEIAGGSYTLHLEHPMDANGKYLLLEEDMLIKAPVPMKHVPAFALPDVRVWKVTAQTPLYSKLPVYKRNPNSVSGKDFAKAANDLTSAYNYDSSKLYSAGALVTVPATGGGKVIYKAQWSNKGVTPGTDSFFWAFAGTLQGGQSQDTKPTYVPGVVAETLQVNASVKIISDMNSSFVQVESAGGNKGWVSRDALEEQQITQSGEVIPAHDITEQVFRIYSISSEDDTNTVTVEANHISYDFAGNALYECKVTKATVQEAIANVIGNLMLADNRRIASNITGGEISKDWSYKNPVNALLDPDGGIVPESKGMLVRDNGDFYILDGSNPTHGITIEYGVNMLGVQWTKSTENVITRIMPRCKNGNTDYLYIDNLFVVSSNESYFPVPRIEVLNCNYQVGKEFTKPDGTKVTLDEAGCKVQMLEDAQKRFSKDHVDTIKVTLDVEFLLLGDTEDYQQYKGLQRVNLYDMVTVNTGKSGITATAQVNEYEYDCILNRYNSIKLGEINSFGRRVAGYRLVDNSIGMEKLSPDVVNQIYTSGNSSSSNSGVSDGGTGASSTSISVIDNLTSTSTTDALSANQGNVLNTKKAEHEASGNYHYFKATDGSTTYKIGIDPTNSRLQLVVGSTTYTYSLTPVT